MRTPEENDNDIDIVSDTESIYDQDTSDRRYHILNEDNSTDSERFVNRDTIIFPRDTSNRISPVNSDFEPFRMSFLDPELLGSVQNIQRETWSDERNSRGNDDDHILEVAEVAQTDSSRAPDNMNPPNPVTDCDLPSRRRQFLFSRRSRWS